MIGHARAWTTTVGPRLLRAIVEDAVVSGEADGARTALDAIDRTDPDIHHDENRGGAAGARLPEDRRDRAGRPSGRPGGPNVNCGRVGRLGAGRGIESCRGGAQAH
jgi:hypothetical protein